MNSTILERMNCPRTAISSDRVMAMFKANDPLVIMSSIGGETGDRNRRLTQHLGNWTDADNTGLSFDSSTGFKLPNGAERSPDAAWVRSERWEALTEDIPA